jgi:hypothetical protein
MLPKRTRISRLTLRRSASNSRRTSRHDVVPVVGALPAAVVHRLAAGDAVVELDPRDEPRLLLRRDPPEDPHRVFPLDLVARMGHAVGELARGGQYQQAAGVEIEPPHCEPLAAAQPGKLVENAGPPAGVVVAHDLAFRLVVQQHPRRHGLARACQRAPVDLDDIARPYSRPDDGGLSVHGDAPALHQRFHLAARSQAGLRQRLVQLDGPAGWSGRRRFH